MITFIDLNYSVQLFKMSYVIHLALLEINNIVLIPYETPLFLYDHLLLCYYNFLTLIF